MKNNYNSIAYALSKLDFNAVINNNKIFDRLNIYIGDIETTTSKNGYIEFLVGVIRQLNSDHYSIFYKREDMAEYIMSFRNPDSKNKYLFYFHNGFNFDYPLLLGYDYILKSRNKLVSNVDIYNVKYDNLELRDSYKLLPLSLKEIGKSINMLKGEYQEELATMDRAKALKEINEITEYCKRDVDITAVIIKIAYVLKNIFHIKNLPLTIGGFSTKIFQSLNNIKFEPADRKKMNSYTDYMIHDYRDISFLKSYYGGRVEAFYLGKYESEHIYVYDVNNMYGSVMANMKNRYPMKFIKIVDNPDPETFNKILNNYEGMGLFEIDNTASTFGFYDDHKRFINIGLLPYKQNIGAVGKKIIYPHGNWYGYYNFNEIRYVLKYGYKVRPIQLSVWDSSNFRYFSNFVNILYREKQKNNAFKSFYKTAINSLYGKLIETINDTDFQELTDYELYQIGEDKLIYDYSTYSKNDKRIYKISNMVKDRTEHTYFNLGSYITSYARIYLSQQMQKAINRNGKIYYCDTDSIFTDVQLPVSNELGDIKIEHEGNGLFILGNKDYDIFEDNQITVHKRKGVDRLYSLTKATDINNKNYKEYYQVNKIMKIKTAYQNDIKKLYHYEQSKVLKYTTKRNNNKIMPNQFQPITRIYENVNHDNINLSDFVAQYKMFNIALPDFFQEDKLTIKKRTFEKILTIE